MKTKYLILLMLLSVTTLKASFDDALSQPSSTITMGTITGSPFCEGDDLEVPFTSSITFTTENIFSAQLSDPTGDFTSPVVIGTLAGNDFSEPIDAELPRTLTSGTGFRIRVISSDPPIVDEDNGVDITINDIPVPLIYGDDTVCITESSNYTSSTFTNCDNLWSVSGGDVVGSATLSTAEIQWETLGMGHITLVRTDQHTNCSATYTTYVLVADYPDSEITGDDTVCVNERFNYSANSNADLEHLWSLEGGGEIVSEVDQSSILIEWDEEVGSATISHTSTNIYTECETVSTFEVLKQKKFGAYIDGSEIVCENGKFFYNTHNSDLMSNEWTVTGGTIVGDNNSDVVEVVWGLPGVGSVRLDQVDLMTGCSDYLIIEPVIHLSPNPVIDGEDIACKNDILEYIANEDSVFMKYSWEVEGGTIIGPKFERTVTVQWTDAPSGTITLRENYTGYGCWTEMELPVTVMDKPEVYFDPIPDACFEDVRIQLSEGKPQGGFYSGPGVVGKRFHPIVAGVGMHTIHYFYTNEAGCSDSANTTITVNPLPNQPMIIFRNDTLLSSPGESYSWYYNSTILPGQTNEFLVPLQNGDYSVKIVDTNGCESPNSENYNYIKTGVIEATVENGIVIYPNPVDEILSVHFEVKNIQNIRLSVSSIDGRRIINKQYPSFSGLFNMSYNFENFTPGIYVVNIFIGNKSYQKKIAVRR